MTFTLGPWRLHDMERATIVAGRPGGEVANCLNGFGDQDANARMISATPELLDAAKIGREYIAKMLEAVRLCNDSKIDGARSDFAKINAAITKATGEQS